MTDKEFLLALYRMVEANVRVSVLVENYLKEHENDEKFNLLPLNSREYDEYQASLSKKDSDLENFYCGGL